MSVISVKLSDKFKRKEVSLRFSLIVIVLCCWFFPMLLIVNVLNLYISESIERQLDGTIGTSVSNVGYIARHTVQYAVTVSKEANCISKAYGEYAETNNLKKLSGEINSFLNRQYRFDNNILAAAIFFYDNTEIVYSTYNPTLSAPLEHVSEYKNKMHKRAVRLVQILDSEIGFITYKNSLYLLKNIFNQDNEPFAAIVLKLNMNNINNAFDSVLWKENAALYLNGVYINPCKNSNNEKSLAKPDKSLLKEGSFSVSYNEKLTSVKGYEFVSGVDILYAIEIDREKMAMSINNFGGILGLLSIMFFPLLAFVLWYFYRNIFVPIKILSTAAGCIQDGKLGMKTDTIMPNKEFEYLNASFNQMSVRLKQQFEKLYDEELALRDARIMALQFQINPHFLNNTLEIINWEARMGNNVKVSRMIESLSTTLDAALDRKNQPIVALSQELTYLDAYLYIISVRFGKRLTVKKEIDKTLLHYLVPRLVLQPIAENAVEHGVSHLSRGELIIRVYKNTDKENKDSLMLEIENNNTLTPENKERIERLLSPDYDEGSLNLGIHNVNMRLKIIYGDGAGLVVTGGENRTISTISIPIEDKLC